MCAFRWGVFQCPVEDVMESSKLSHAMVQLFSPLMPDT